MIEQQRVYRIKDRDSLLDFLREDLCWDLPEASIDDVSFEWTGLDLNLSEDINKKLKGGLIRQLQPFATHQPWGIFVVEFATREVSIITLRQILRCFVAKRRGARPDLPVWQCENLLFICLYGENGFTFAHFKGGKPYSAKLTTFSWHPGEPIRTVCEFNLPVLVYDYTWTPETWVEEWQKAFDVEKVNKDFYKQIAWFYYRLTGKEGQKRELVLPYVGDDSGSISIYEEFAVRLIGRSIFCWFLKHKVSEESNVPLIPPEALSLAAAQETEDFYHSILEPLFFEVLNKPLKDRISLLVPRSEIIPFLNGGLFEPHPNDFYQGVANYGLKIPAAWFVDFFSLLERYNFTITENSSIDVDVAVDPEMLGRIFENLLAEVSPETGETARKATGSYYTPRTIVDYMVDQSIKRYLFNKTGVDEGKLADLLSYEEPEVILSGKEKDSIISALDEIKIIDPACGSGAFPMGILHKILLVLGKTDPEMKRWFKQKFGTIDDVLLKKEIMERLEKENWEYVRKLLIIRNSIYGVDIQTIAVEISKLRFFLSLVVDEKIDDQDENRGVKPLPNLEFKFVAANTLIGVPKPETKKKALIDFEDNESIEALAKIRNSYFTSYGEDRLEVKKDFTAVQQKMFEFYLQNLNQEQRNLVGAVKKVNTSGKTATQMLSEWEPFSFKRCDWFDPKWMFGVADGFDIVIGNPPYLRVQGIQQTQPEYMSHYRDNYQSAKGNFDLYALFIERGYQLLNSQGQFAYIVPHKFFQASFGGALRQFLTERGALREIVRFGSSQVFEESTTYTCLLFLGAEPSSSFDLLEVKTLGRGEETLQAARTRTKHPDYSFEECPEPAISQDNKAVDWDFSIGEDKRIVERLRQHSRTLDDITRKIFVGLQTSADKIYVLRILDEYKGSYLCYSNYWEEEVEIERGLVKPFLMGKDVHRYEPVKAQNVVIFPYVIRSGRAELMSQEYIQAAFPMGWDYINQNKKELAAREHGRFAVDWHAFSRPQNLTEFETVKIMTPDICGKPEMSIDLTGELYHTTTIYSFAFKPNLNKNPKFLLGLLNSKLMWYFLCATGTPLRGDYRRFKTEYLKPFPIAESTLKQERLIETLVDYVLYLKSLGKPNEIEQASSLRVMTAYFEQLIDALVYEMYFPEEFVDSSKSPSQLLIKEQLPAISELKGDKASNLRKLFRRLYATDHPVRSMIFFLDTLETVRAIEAKSKLL